MKFITGILISIAVMCGFTVFAATPAEAVTTTQVGQISATVGDPCQFNRTTAYNTVTVTNTSDTPANVSVGSGGTSYYISNLAPGDSYTLEFYSSTAKSAKTLTYGITTGTADDPLSQTIELSNRRLPAC